MLLLRCSCHICSAHLGAPASRPVSPELGMTTKVTPHFCFSKLIINLQRFQLVTRTCIFAWPSSLRFPVCCCSRVADSTSGRAYCSWKGCFYTWLCPKHLEVLVALERPDQILGGPGKPNVISSLQTLPAITFGARPKPWSKVSLGLGETRKSRIKCGTSSPCRAILTLPAHHWLAHLGTGCCWLSVPCNSRQHLPFFCNCSSGALHPPVLPAQQSEKQREMAGAALLFFFPRTEAAAKCGHRFAPTPPQAGWM